jgi:DnaA family protein
MNERLRPTDAMQQLPLGVRLGEAARFDGYVAGPNAEVLSLLTSAATPRVLWLWGRRGTGKTHLLQAACAATSEQGGAATYLDLEAGGAPALLEGCETLGLVCLDGLERVSTDADWNTAIFRLYTLMQDGQGRLYVASTAPPASLRFRLPDLRSRLLAAPVHQLHGLDEAGQIEALEWRAARRGLELSREAAAYLVHRMPRDMHSLCGVLDRLDEAALAAQRRLTVPFLRQVLEADQSLAVP